MKNLLPDWVRHAAIEAFWLILLVLAGTLGAMGLFLWMIMGARSPW